MSLITIDIETECAVSDCAKGAKCYTDFKHGLIPHKNRITCVGVYSDDYRHVFRGDEPSIISNFTDFINSHYSPNLIFHNGAFDIKNLVNKGADLESLLGAWTYDTQLLAYVFSKKVSPKFMREYADQRVRLNKELPSGYSHRSAGIHSLKTLAPFFLGVAPFWEDPTNHNDDEYVLKDCEYTHLLCKYLLENMDDAEMQFCREKQLPWAKELLRAEIQGVSVDQVAMTERESTAKSNRDLYAAKIKENWKEYFQEYASQKIEDIEFEYAVKEEKQLEKAKTSEQEARIRKRYAQLYDKRIKKLSDEGALGLNLNSPLQLTWLLKERLGLNIINFDGKESTDKEVLERLAQHNNDIKDLLEYRKWEKLCSTYYPSYREFVTNEGRIHCSFNTSVTRTGRLSSSMPNLQNQPPETHELFVADAGKVLITQDLSAIEPRLAAYYSEDAELCNVVINGLDFHGRTAKAIFPYITCDNSEIKGAYPRERYVAKTAGLAILYGSGANRLRNILFKKGFTDYSVTDCRALVKRVRALYAGVWEFKQNLDRALENGKTAYNLFGRPILFNDPDEVYMKGFNRLIQGSASDLVQNAIYRYNTTQRELGIDSQALITVHDEIVVQAPMEMAEKCSQVLTDCMTYLQLTTRHGNIPLLTEGAVGRAWSK